jgi:hypothetical protein
LVCLNLFSETVFWIAVLALSCGRINETGFSFLARVGFSIRGQSLLGKASHGTRRQGLVGFGAGGEVRPARPQRGPTKTFLSKGSCCVASKAGGNPPSIVLARQTCRISSHRSGRPSAPELFVVATFCAGHLPATGRDLNLSGRQSSASAEPSGLRSATSNQMPSHSSNRRVP